MKLKHLVIIEKNNKYNIEDKENIIMNPIKENEKNKRKNEDKNTFQKLIDSKKRKKEMEEKKYENNKINEESDIIEEESINNNNNNKIENEENSDIENEIEEESKTYRKSANNPILTEKLINIFQVRNKIETSEKKNIQKIREMKYDSDDSLSSEEIKTKKKF